MKRFLIALALTVSGFSPLAAGVVTPASATCAPPSAGDVVYSFRNASKSYQGTNLASAWITPTYGPASVTYNQTSTMEFSASMTATVSAEAGIIFAKASTSLAVTVGASYSKSNSWSYTQNVPKDPLHMYRAHLYTYTETFQVMKKTFDYSKCNYLNSWSAWQTVTHAPIKSNQQVWRTDRQAA